MDTTQAFLAEKDVSPASRLLTLAGIVVVVAGLYFGRQVLAPLALAIVLAFLLTPVVALLERAHLGRTPSVVAVLFLSLALLAAVGWGVTNQLMEIFSLLPGYRTNIHNKVEAIRARGRGGLGGATATVTDLSNELSAASETAAIKKTTAKGTERQPIPVQVAAPPRTAAEYLRDIAGPLTGVLETIGIVGIFTVFVLLKREDLRNRLLRLAGSSQLNVMTQALDEASQRLGRYLLLQLVVNVGYGVLFGLGVYLIGIPHALLWGAFGTLLRFIPYIGTPVAAALPMGIALAVFPGWSQVGLTFVLFLVLELSTANLIEPWLYGAHTGISSLAILVSAVFWGILWGPAGLILSTPLTLCLILAGRYIPRLNFIEILLGDAPVLSPQVHFYQRLLALDDEEARDIANKYLTENPMGDLYDSILVPALSLAERDRHLNVLDEKRTKFIYRSIRDLIADLYEAAPNPKSLEGHDVSATEQGARISGGPKVVCVPARDEADEIVGTMVMQLLQRAGYKAESLSIAAVTTMLEQVEHLQPELVCVSALPPFAAGQAKTLCKQLRQRAPNARIILGLWGFPGGTAKALERVGSNCADMIGISLAQVVSLIQQASNAAG